MCTRRVGRGVLAVLALACALARSDDTRTPQSEDPDPGFLEFLGSVDRLDRGPRTAACACRRCEPGRRRAPTRPAPHGPPDVCTSALALDIVSLGGRPFIERAVPAIQQFQCFT